jgi:hypothetical protein
MKPVLDLIGEWESIFVIASPDLLGRGNLYLQYLTGISPVIKNILKYFPQKRRIFGICVV